MRLNRQVDAEDKVDTMRTDHIVGAQPMSYLQMTRYECSEILAHKTTIDKAEWMSAGANIMQ